MHASILCKKIIFLVNKFLSSPWYLEMLNLGLEMYTSAKEDR
jgi:hypothetical protein